MADLVDLVRSEVVSVTIGAQLELSLTKDMGDSGYETWRIVSEGDAMLRVGGVTRRIGPSDAEGFDPAAAVALYGLKVENVELSQSGRLLVGFESLTELTLLAHEFFESWFVFGPGDVLVAER